MPFIESWSGSSMERDERETGSNSPKRGKQAHRLVGIHVYGEFARMSAGCYGNGGVVLRLSSLTSVMDRRFGGSWLSAPMSRRMSLHSRVLTSLKSTVVMGRKWLVTLMSSRGPSTN